MTDHDTPCQTQDVVYTTRDVTLHLLKIQDPYLDIKQMEDKKSLDFFEL